VLRWARERVKGAGLREEFEQGGRGDGVRWGARANGPAVRERRTCWFAQRRREARTGRRARDVADVLEVVEKLPSVKWNQTTSEVEQVNKKEEVSMQKKRVEEESRESRSWAEEERAKEKNPKRLEKQPIARRWQAEQASAAGRGTRKGKAAFKPISVRMKKSAGARGKGTEAGTAAALRARNRDTTWRRQKAG